MGLTVKERINVFDPELAFATIPNASKAVETYKRFYDQFNEWNKAQKEMSEHKYFHTLQVALLMVELAPEKEDEEIYFWAGMLHDFGRYYDIAKGSFKGSSINHAQVGADVLFKYRMIKLFDVPEEYYESLEFAIRYHGVLSLEEAVEEAGVELTDKQWQLCKDIRTADKWDIMDFLIWMPTTETVGTTESEIAKLTVSEKTMEELLNAKPVNRGLPGEEYTHMRHFLSHVGFIYDDNDARLMKWLYKGNWVKKYLDKLFQNNPKDAEKLKAIQEAAEKYLEEYNKH